MNKISTIYFIEYQDTIVFFKGNSRLEIIKNAFTFKKFLEIKNKYNFKNLMGV